MQMFRLDTESGYKGDRIETGQDLGQSDQLNERVPECQVERTVALVQLASDQNPDPCCQPLKEQTLPEWLLVPLINHGDWTGRFARTGQRNLWGNNSNSGGTQCVPKVHGAGFGGR